MSLKYAVCYQQEDRCIPKTTKQSTSPPLDPETRPPRAPTQSQRSLSPDLQHKFKVRVVAAELGLVRRSSSNELCPPSVGPAKGEGVKGGDDDGKDGETEGDPETFGVARSFLSFVDEANSGA